MATAEAFAYAEGALYVWSGSHTASGTPAAWVEDINLTLDRRWSNDASLAGVYRDHLVGLAARLNISLVETVDQRLRNLFNSATAVHIKMEHNHLQGSAGIVVYSGRIDSLVYQSQAGGITRFSLAAHGNIWSGF